MHILPITSAKPQSRPNFQARVPKPLVKQMLNKLEPLTNLEIKSARGLVYTVPAMAAAKLYAADADKEASEKELSAIARAERLPSKEELLKMDDLSFIETTSAQDKNGKTIFHVEGNLEPLKRFFDTCTCEHIAETFLKTDNQGKTAYLANKDEYMKHEMQNKLTRTAAFGDIPIDKSIELLEKNKLNKNLIKFMKARAEKPSSSNSNNIKVKEALYNQILESKGDKVNVETSDATYLGLPIAEAAKFFTPDEKNFDFEKLDADYLNKADSDELQILLNSAFSREEVDAIQDICRNWRSVNKRFAGEMISAIDLSRPKSQHIDIMLHYMQPNEVKELYERTDSEMQGLMHHAANASRVKDDFRTSLDTLTHCLSGDDVEEIMLTKDIRGNIPATITDEAAIIAMDYFKENPELVAKMLVNRDDFGAGILFDTSEIKVLEKAFEVLKNNPDELADILMLCNANGDTAYTYHKEMGHSKEIKNALEEKITELAVDSDLSVKESINLLEINELHPQIANYLRYQK